MGDDGRSTCAMAKVVDDVGGFCVVVGASNSGCAWDSFFMVFVFEVKSGWSSQYWYQVSSISKEDLLNIGDELQDDCFPCEKSVGKVFLVPVALLYAFQ